MMQRRSLAGLSIGVLGLCAAGCFPSLPGCDDDCRPADTGASATETTTATSGPTVTTVGTGDETATTDNGSTASNTGDSGSSTDTGGGAPAACDANLSPMGWIEQDVVWGNERFEVRFGLGNAGGPLELIDHCGSQDNLLYVDETQLETRMGVLGFDIWNQWDDLGSSTVTQTGEVGLEILFQWSNTNSDVSGESRYTILADGRIVRDEMIHLAQVPEFYNWLVAYSAFDNAAFSELVVEGFLETSYPVNGDMPTFNFLFELLPSQWVSACLHDPANGNAIGWTAIDRGDTGNLEWVGLRATEALPKSGNASVALQTDFFRMGFSNGGIGDYRANHLLVVGGNDRGSCDYVLTHANTYRDSWEIGPPPITVTGPATYQDYHFASGGHDLYLDGTGVGDITFQVEETSVEDSPTLLLAIFDVVGAGTSITGIRLGDDDLVAGTDYLVQTGEDVNMTPFTWVLVDRTVIAGGDPLVLSFE